MTSRCRDFIGLTSSLPLNKEVNAVVLRDGKELTFKVKPLERGQIYLQQTELKEWGMVVRNFFVPAGQGNEADESRWRVASSVRPGGAGG